MNQDIKEQYEKENGPAIRHETDVPMMSNWDTVIIGGVVILLSVALVSLLT